MVQKMQKKTLIKAGISLQPLTVRIRPLLKWGFIDRIVIEAMAVNNDTKGLFGENEFPYFKLIPFFTLLTIAIFGLITGNIYVSLIVPVLIAGILIQRYFIISDGLDVIGRMQEVKDGIEFCLIHIHSEGSQKVEYDTDYIQPIIVDYLKRGGKLSGRQIINIYIQLRHATKHKFMNNFAKTANATSKEDKKSEFNNIFCQTKKEANSTENFELDILTKAPKKDQEFVKKAADIKDALIDMDSDRNQVEVNKNSKQHLNNVELRNAIKDKISSKASAQIGMIAQNSTPIISEKSIDIIPEIKTISETNDEDFQDENTELTNDLDFDEFPDDEQTESGENYDDDELVRMIKDFEKEDIK
jgi:hypothetical protein